MTSDFDLSGCNKQAESLLLTSPGIRDSKRCPVQGVSTLLGIRDSIAGAIRQGKRKTPDFDCGKFDRVRRLAHNQFSWVQLPVPLPEKDVKVVGVTVPEGKNEGRCSKMRVAFTIVL